MRATNEMPLAEAKALATRRINKFGNEAVCVGAFSFASKAEADRYAVLAAAERAGQIEHLRIHPRYLLQAAFTTPDGHHERPVCYVADFEYVEDGHLTTEESKGFSTEVWKIKRKLFLYRYGDRYQLRVTYRDGTVETFGATPQVEAES